MSVATFVHRSEMPASADTVFDWHARPGAFERLAPPWEDTRLVRQEGSIDDGVVELSVGVGPLRTRWIARHEPVVDALTFRDVQESGPFARWEHTHRVEAAGPDRATLEDRIEYALPGGALGRLFGGAAVRRKLERVFAYRHRVLRDDLAARGEGKGTAMKIAITGASGLVGTALAPLLTSGGDEVVRMVRTRGGGDGTAFWDAETGEVDTAALEGVDAVVHLAGAGIADKRWNTSVKNAIRTSRVNGTRAIASALAGMENPPKVLVCASAIGFYGDRGSEELHEDSAPGTGFLAEVSQAWEAAADPARAAGIRVVHLRIGIILSPKGGALASMLTPFKMGVGGIMGSGEQYWSWISIDDVCGVIAHAIRDESLSGPVNTVAPAPATNRQFTKTLGSVLSRPTIFPMPAFAARIVLGEMADHLILASTRVLPKRLSSAGYTFRHPNLEDALRHVLGK